MIKTLQTFFFRNLYFIVNRANGVYSNTHRNLQMYFILKMRNRANKEQTNYKIFLPKNCSCLVFVKVSCFCMSRKSLSIKIELTMNLQHIIEIKETPIQ